MTIPSITIALTGFILAGYWFGWKLILVLFLVIWGNNLYLRSREEK